MIYVGQSIIAACSQLILFSVRAIITGDSTKYEYSSFLLLCFLGSALAVMKYNAFPSQVFIGDTFCYYAGIVLALSAIYGTYLYYIHSLDIHCRALPIHSTINQFPILMSTIIWICTMSSAPINCL